MFKIGDYVIADNDPTDNWDGYTFVITGSTRNIIGGTLLKVRDIETDTEYVFYPHELSWEDGTRPTQ